MEAVEGGAERSGIGLGFLYQAPVPSKFPRSCLTENARSPSAQVASKGDYNAQVLGEFNFIFPPPHRPRNLFQYSVDSPESTTSFQTVPRFHLGKVLDLEISRASKVLATRFVDTATSPFPRFRGQALGPALPR